MISKIVVFSALFSLAVALPHKASLTLHESRPSAPPGFVRSSAAGADGQVRLRIALVQSDTEGLVDSVYAVSTPSSPRYGKHLTKEEVEKFVAPADQSVAAVHAWLKQANVTAETVSPAGDWLSISVPLSKANELFDADFDVYIHTASGKQAIRTLSYSIPTELVGHLSFVHPTVSFPTPNARLPVVTTLAAPSRRGNERRGMCTASAITPGCVQSLYGLPATKATSLSNQLAVTAFDAEYSSMSDMLAFMKKYRTDVTSTSAYSTHTLDGGQASGSAGVEANLDIQYTAGIATGVPLSFYSVGAQYKDGTLEGFLDIVNSLLGQTNPPQVITTSYGFDESEIPRSLANNLCNAYAQLSARGTSILFASGDGGVAGSQGQSCSQFIPTFPSGCPFVTSVGATQLSGTTSETAAAFSSGGFSNYFGTPSYQASAVSSYLSSIGSTNSGQFNASGRAYPDVAAIGTSLQIIVGGAAQSVDGTSCSSPIFASTIALINDALMMYSKSTLGFLNPFLYANPNAFHDITTGSNPGCGTNGFTASKGWDPVTGLGTPNFSGLRMAALKAAGV